jgi:YVTN family beta-propeller protein
VARYASLLLIVFVIFVSTLVAPRPRTAAEQPPLLMAAPYRLPNGWTVSPAGRQVPVRDLPLNIVPFKDSRHALVATNGFNTHQLSLIDLTSGRVLTHETVFQSWYGLALSPDGDRAWWSGGGGGRLHTFNIGRRTLTRTSPAEPDPDKMTKEERAKQKEAMAKDHAFRSGLALDPARDTLYTLDINAGTITAVHPADGSTGKSAPCGRRPYDVALARDGTRLYVSDWATSAVLVLDSDTLRTVARIATGEHPNQIAVHPTDGRLFVACASSNCVSVIDGKRNEVAETVMTAMFPRAPEGSTPDALALAPDGRTLYVANADNNCVAVIDVAVPGHSQVKGFVPTGWYPTAVAVTPDGRTLLVGVGKGNRTWPNPFRDEEDPKTGSPSRRRRYPYVGELLSGALSVVPVPGERELAAYTAAVYRNCPYSDQLLDRVLYPQSTAIPTKVGDPSPIEHVIYIIKENRTYDQVFGDMKEGNGDPRLVMFGERITPNHHKLAREFVLFDNLYCNAQVSRDGHPWSTMAYNTDYVARDWTLTYSQRKGVDDDEEGHLSRAPSGYLWDACARKGLSYRSYGEFGRRVSQSDGLVKMEASVPGLVGHICPSYDVPREPGQRARDTDNVATFLREFREFEKNGNLPRFIVMSLGEDHTSGTKPGAYTPEACVASNDLALGWLVEAVSHSKYWPRTAIFVIEDDPQDGPDHVDAHRTVGLVISPYTKRHHVDHTQYSTVSMLRTLELILGLPPLSQYDAAARPMFASFTDKPDLAPYVHTEARTDLTAKNGKDAYGAERSARMDFSEYDRVDDHELNEILWRAIKGKDAPVPPPVRRAIASRPVDGLASSSAPGRR